MRFIRSLTVGLIAFSLFCPPTLRLAVAQVPELPRLGDAGGEELPPQLERKLGEQIMQEVRADPDFLSDPDSTDYLNHLGYQLVSVSQSRALDFQFFIVRDPMLNAFALPGGFIGVHSGLIIAAQSESELAGVMGHEIGHVTQRHIARMLAKQKESYAITIGSLLLALLASRVGGSSSGDLFQAAAFGGQAAVIQKQLNFSRDAEREADRVGFQTLLAAGFDPRAMENFFTRLQQGSRIYEGTSEGTAAPAYLRTHPLTTERIGDMQNRTRGLPYKQHADSLDFKLIQARLRVLQGTTTQSTRETLEYFTEQLARHSAPSEVAARYGAGVAALKLNLPELAQQNALAARHLTIQSSAILDKLVSETQLANAHTPEEKEKGVRQAADFAARFPLSPMAVGYYLNVLQNAQHYDEAIAYLREQSAISRGEPTYFALLARSYTALNKNSLAHQSTAEMYALLGAKQSAVLQLEIARRSNDADFYTMSEIDARLRDLQAQVRADIEESRNSGQQPDTR